jgi:hypothetical protein
MDTNAAGAVADSPRHVRPMVIPRVKLNVSENVNGKENLNITFVLEVSRG